jgi:tRNA pseudouridine55 synthase
MATFVGRIEQVPSAVSAIKVDGQRAYRRVRSGETVELPARPVTVTRFDMSASSRPTPELLDLDVEVECSSGTYVRALARDVGRALGVGGHLVALRRTRVGPFTVDMARTLDDLVNAADPVQLTVAEAVRIALPAREIDDAQARELSFGRALRPAGISGVHGAFAPDGSVVALLREVGDSARPVLVFAPAG